MSEIIKQNKKEFLFSILLLPYYLFVLKGVVLFDLLGLPGGAYSGYGDDIKYHMINSGSLTIFFSIVFYYISYFIYFCVFIFIHPISSLVIIVPIPLSVNISTSIECFLVPFSI